MMTETTPENGDAGQTLAPVSLLCCPWCGDTPKLKNGKVKCANIMCKVQPKTKAWYAKGYDQNAIADWNSMQQHNAKLRHGANNPNV